MTQIEYIPGDWVKASGQLCRVEEVFVNRLTKEYEYTLIYPNGNSSRIVIGDIEPIPLTPEILEKNGWKGSIYHSCKGDATYAVPYYIKYVEEDREISHIAIGFYRHGTTCEVWHNGHFLRRPISYIHQLQHLLFSLKLNSEIKI